MDICRMCTHHLEEKDGDISCKIADCYEYLEFDCLPIYSAAAEMYKALKSVQFLILGKENQKLVANALAKAEGKEEAKPNEHRPA